MIDDFVQVMDDNDSYSIIIIIHDLKMIMQTSKITHYYQDMDSFPYECFFYSFIFDSWNVIRYYLMRQF